MTPRDFIFLFIELRHEIARALGLEADLKVSKPKIEQEKQS